MDPADEDVTPGWRFVSAGREGETANVAGFDPWQADWEPTGESILVRHPQHAEQRHRMTVYTLPGTPRPSRFAAGELSNGVWGFYVPA